MKQDKFEVLKPLIEIGWGDELKVYQENGDLLIIKVKRVERYPNYKILFDGKYYYLIDSEDNFICKNKVKTKLIPDGFIRML